MAWFNASWLYRKKKTITAAGSIISDFTVTGGLVPLNLHQGVGVDDADDLYFDNNCEDYFADIRITLSDGSTEVPFYFRELTQTAAELCVCLDVDTNPQDIYIYYGNALASSASSIDDTFLFGDDFSNVDGWVKYAGNPIIVNGGSYDTVICGDPCVRKNGVGDWQMWYYAYDGVHTYVMYAYAANPEGPWTKWDDGGGGIAPLITDYQKPWVVKDSSGHYHMWASSLSSPRTINYFYTTDGGGHNPYGPFTTYAGNPVISPVEAWEDNFNDCPCVIYDDDDENWKMWYSAGTVSGEPEYWMYATSDDPTIDGDPTDWTKDPADGGRIKSPGVTTKWYDQYLGCIKVYKEDGIYYGMFTSYDYANICRIGYTTTTDPTDWTLQETDLIIDLGDFTDFDKEMCYTGTMMNDGGTLRIWYNGRKHDNDEQIGYATYQTSQSIIDTSKWMIAPPNFAASADYAYSISSGVMCIDSSLTGVTAYAPSLQTVSYKPPANVVIENRSRWDSTSDAFSSFYPFLLCNRYPIADFSTYMQFVLWDESDDKVKHQSRNAGAWGGEDQIYAAHPTFATYYISQIIIESASMSWRIYDDSWSLLGAVNGNADAPQGVSYYMYAGTRGAETYFDWVTVRKYSSTEPQWDATGPEERQNVRGWWSK